MSPFLIEDKYYTLSEVYQCIKDKRPISLSKITREKIRYSNEALRSSIKNGKNIRPLLPNDVWKYLDEMNFYK